MADYNTITKEELIGIIEKLIQSGQEEHLQLVYEMLEAFIEYGIETEIYEICAKAKEIKETIQGLTRVTNNE